MNYSRFTPTPLVRTELLKGAPPFQVPWSTRPMHVSNVEAEAFKRCCAGAKPASVNLRSHVPTGPVGNALVMELPVARAALQRGVEEAPQ